MNGPRGFPSWEDLYRNDTVEKLPWYWPALDPDLEAALVRYEVRSGSFLDLGTGPGTQAIALAERGFKVTATDISPAAIAYAARKAKAQGVDVSFMTDDILATQLTGPYGGVFDRGCFHVIAPELRGSYAKTMHRLLAPTGWLFPIASRPTTSASVSEAIDSRSSRSSIPSIKGNATRGLKRSFRSFG
jgi:2-polyprenyl-3-methyl-5-hydroxy-6-metoxy-1,4-benzoquinol methylase